MKHPLKMSDLKKVVKGLEKSLHYHELKISEYLKKEDRKLWEPLVNHHGGFSEGLAMAIKKLENLLQRDDNEVIE